MTEYGVPTTEEWKDLPGFDGRYRISNFGRVMSMARIQRHGYGHFATTVRVDQFMLPRVNKDGRLRTGATATLPGGKSKSVKIFIAREVYRLFVKDITRNDCIRHRDGNPWHCWPGNLYLVSKAEVAQENREGDSA